MTKLTRGKLFAGYRIVERLGSTVYQVEDASGRHAALRIIDDAPAAALSRCFTDACTTATIAHPAIARTYDVGSVDDHAFIVSELVDGEPLSCRMRKARKPMPLADALRLTQRIANALSVAHDKGLAHGGLCPDTILVGDRGLSLIGFGLAALGGGDPMTCIDALPPPIYTAPEQCRAMASYEPTSDLYALGCILFELLAGFPPFRSKSWGELVTSHLMAPPPALPASTPRPIRDLVDSLLAKSPGQRPSADYVVHVLAGAIDDLELSAIPRAPWRWIAALAVSVSLVIPQAYAQASEKMQDVFHNVDVTSLPL